MKKALLITALLAAVGAAARSVQQIDADIESLRAAQSRDPAQLEYLRFQLQELDALAMTADELVELDAEHKRLANAGRLISEGDGAQQLLYGGEASIYDQLSRAVSALHGLSPLHEGFAEAESLAIGAQAHYTPFRAGDVRHSQADISKAQRLLGYQPTHTILQGLQTAMPWYLEFCAKSRVS